MKHASLSIAAIICFLAGMGFQHPLPAEATPAPASQRADVLISKVKAPFKGDLDQMRERRMVRVLVNYSRTRFFLDHGRQHGFEYELLKAYEKELNKGIKAYQGAKLFFIPLPFDQLLTALQEGKGDIAAAGLTITPDREKQVDFTTPYLPDVSEVIIHHRAVKDLNTLENLSGRMVYVRKNSSYVTHLEQLNTRLKKQKLKPIQIKEAQQFIITEDILEMVNAGIIDITVADNHLGKAWRQVMPDIVVREDLAINTGGRIAWAVRKGNPKLRAHLDQFIAKHKKGSLLGNILYNRYYLKASGIRNPFTAQERDKMISLLELFEKYAGRYDFDHLAIVAQAYQESGLDQSKRSPTGALGIMQVLPTTAADKKINVKDIEKLENNVHAGVKYLHFIRKRYFSDPAISPANRVYFSWAAYNAGPAKINSIRRQAAKEGFDPNQWFFHVEHIAAKVIGRETVTYVANINKYYVAYQLQYNMYYKRQKEVETLRKKVGSPDGKPK